MKDFIPYEEALELKQLGFELDKNSVFGYWNLIEHGKDWWTFDTRIHMDSVDYIEAPLFSQAFRFFREKYGLRNRNYGSLNYSGTISEYFEIFQYAKGTSDKVLSIIVGSLTYEEAELACLKKLIELIKQK